MFVQSASSCSRTPCLRALVWQLLLQVFFAALRGRCNASAPGSSGLVLDVGANMGWYSLLAAAMGCRWAAHKQQQPSCWSRLAA